MKLSIVTVNLNNCSGLIKTIESVLAQTFTDFEFIVIDGKSTDGSVDVIRKADLSGIKGKRFHWISEPDKGIYNAMNKGIDIATGEYFLFLNSGDSLVGPQILDTVFSSDLSEDYVFGNINLIRNGEICYRDVKMDFDTPSLYNLYTQCLPHQASFIKRELFEKYGKYDEGLKILGDWEFCIRTLIINNCSVQHLQVTVTDYDLGGVSSTNKEENELEKNGIFQKYFPPAIISDLNKLDLYKKDFKLIDWYNSHGFYKSIVTLIYRIGTKISKIVN